MIMAQEDLKQTEQVTRSATRFDWTISTTITFGGAALVDYYHSHIYFKLMKKQGREKWRSGWDLQVWVPMEVLVV